MSLLRQKSRHTTADNPHARTHRELEVYPSDSSTQDGDIEPEELEEQEEHFDDREGRKSPAALFGSQRIGAVVLPFELQTAITRLIADSDKHALRSDATRLFMHDKGNGEDWDTSYKVQYKSRKQAGRHAERDGTAFASVALPSHYAAIFAVLDHAKRRLGPEWKIKRVIDWGCGTGAGLWATSHSFRDQLHQQAHPDSDDAQLAESTVSEYLGIDKRDGLINIGKNLVKDVNPSGLSLSWQKSFHDDDKISRSNGEDVIGLSAFMLSSLSTSLARKTLVKGMWESGAGVMVLIDHSSTSGFEAIAEARDFLLRMGRKELEDPETESWHVRGCHVVAPCPHDGSCPLYHPGASKLVCGFSQRLQRPKFVRKTKNSGVGHEDTGYSYVVIRRGSRPIPPGTKVGRIGDVGKREIAKLASKQTPVQELIIDHEQRHTTEVPLSASDSSVELLTAEPHAPTRAQPIKKWPETQVEDALRLEAYSWPRLVFPPLKRSGHIILDGCTREGKIMRMTVPKSQGKQPYYDARKSNWGDIFPHAPKNAPQERYQPSRAKGATTPAKGEDIGKRRKAYPQAVDYAQLSAEIEEQKRRQRRQRSRVASGWSEE
ncbi:uncharacterized protein FIBRA_05922 [Fibroporia radiculosa]|uniref:Rsm22-domain-containing protein n=1 Tax=Fibroporia radiculosa TaxID=599839 RepID=J4GRV3_9APHY|nr:uncharacterized protein FIBRA_05922 [Fibroporia radiculosa]CCM03775.1 predicted protein [Fibroporia radiculosa]